MRTRYLFTGLFLIWVMVLWGQQPDVSDTDRNLIYTTMFDVNGDPKTSGVAYYNLLGKPQQTQSWDIKTGKIWVTQTLYDRQGRPAFQSFSAPIGTPATFAYRNNFILTSPTSEYTIDNFEVRPEDPRSLWPQLNTLGGHYSFLNQEELQDVSI